MSTPNSNVKLMSVNFNHTQENVLSFNSRSEQQSYFSNRVVATLNEMTYINHQKRVVRYDSDYDSIDNINYLSFKNSRGRTYYAFVMSKEYINENMTEITYEVDAWQTFMFDIKWSNCFVEREHVTDDSLGANLVNEPFNVSLMPTYTKHNILGTSKDLRILVGVSGKSGDPRSAEVRAGIIDRVVDGDDDFVHGHDILIYKMNEVDRITNMVNKLADKGRDSITGISITPTYMIPDIESHLGGGVKLNKTTYKQWITLPSFKSLMSGVGYTPKNNKLISPQFCKYELINGGGASLDIDPLVTNFNSPKINLLKRATLNPYAVAYVENSVYGNKESISTIDFDMVSWRDDVFAQYMGADKYKRIAKQVSDYAMVGVGIASAVSTGGASLIPQMVGVGMGVRGITNATNRMAEEQDLARTRERSRGETTTRGVNLAEGNNFSVIGFTPNAYDLKRVDDFLTRYGYQVNRYKIPNLRTRSNFNFVKLSDVNIYGDIEGEYMKQLITMFENGVTLWHNHKTYRNFNLENEVIK